VLYELELVAHHRLKHLFSKTQSVKKPNCALDIFSCSTQPPRVVSQWPEAVLKGRLRAERELANAAVVEGAEVVEAVAQRHEKS